MTKTTLPEHQPALAESLSNGWRLRALISLTLLHTLVDASALLIAPLWPSLNQQFQFGTTGLTFAFIVQALPTSLSQAVFGVLRDRISTPIFLWTGPLVAILFLSLVGFPTHFGVLCFLLIVGGTGVGAFHPESAVTAGRLFPSHKTRSLSVFMLGGTLGLCLGPLLSGIVVENYGLKSLVWLIPGFAIGIFSLMKFGQLMSVSRYLKQEMDEEKELLAVAEESSSETPTVSRTIVWKTVGLMAAMLMICSLRLVPNQALDKVISFHLESQKFSTSEIAQVQSLFLASASLGMMLMAFFFRNGWEKRFMIFCPLLSAPMLWYMGQPECSVIVFIALLVPVGVILWGTASAMVSYGQYLFPKGAGFASALTMGMAWGVGSLIQAPITSYFQDQDRVSYACTVFVIPVLLSAVFACFLPGMPGNPATESIEK
ncbi:Fosmidomycin resistance protein [Polystyrenella longa]|uniref:Fosmidomycin resistance protein n=1 Tax=Polystyrenella longa TaxID=2528007 RepID=A0A518CSA5_9PLAN|nr:MFS transporter [Polystyrenella longa]QDU82095.1 Fosmidomycin resistance protein [Polystyrenella longa]